MGRSMEGRVGGSGKWRMGHYTDEEVGVNVKWFWRWRGESARSATEARARILPMKGHG